MMQKFTVRLIISLVLCIIAIAGTAHAQGQARFDVGPLLGYYRPFGRFNPEPLLSTDLPRQPSDLSSTAWGGEMRLAIRDRLSIAGVFATAASTMPSVTSPGPGGVLDPTGERVNLFIIEGQYNISSSRARYDLLLSAGPALVQHSGTGYRRYGSPQSWGGAFGAEFLKPLTSQLQISARATGVAYWFDLDFPPEHGPQLDALVFVGLRWHLPDASASSNPTR